MNKNKIIKKKIVSILKKWRLCDEFEFMKGGGKKGEKAVKKYFEHVADLIMEEFNAEVSTVKRK